MDVYFKENFENNRNDLGVALYLHIFTRYEKTRNGSIFIIPTPCSLLNHFSEAFLGIMWEKAKAITELTRWKWWFSFKIQNFAWNQPGWWFSTILKNISQWEGLSHILWKIKHVWNHQPEHIPACFGMFVGLKNRRKQVAEPTSSTTYR